MNRRGDTSWVCVRGALLLASALVGGCASGGVAVDAGSLERVERLESELTRAEDPERYALRWQLASACLDVVDHPETAPGRKLEFARKALASADAAVAQRARRVEGHYYRAVSLGRVLEHATIPEVSKIGELEAAGQRARELDPAFKCAGPLRLLALLYQKAPAWPLGPDLAGDEDAIEALFTEAIALASSCPENYLCYAEFLLEADRGDDARRHTRRARELLALGEEPLEPYQQRDLERRIGEVLDPKRPCPP